MTEPPLTPATYIAFGPIRLWPGNTVSPAPETYPTILAALAGEPGACRVYEVESDNDPHVLGHTRVRILKDVTPAAEARPARLETRP